jgi:hypothetical protein
MESVPNLFIVGAAKCGTTHLHWLLSTHRQACMSTLKEPHFFADTYTGTEEGYGPERVDTLEDYLALFPGAADAQVVGEASPSYLFDPNAPARIADFSPDAKIIVLLRDPVARVYSHYLMDVHRGRQTLPIAQALEEDNRVQPRVWGGRSHLYMDLSFYHPPVARFFALFPADQILVLEAGDHQADGRATHTVVAEFLDIDQDGFTSERETIKARNNYTQPRSRVTAGILKSRTARAVGDRLMTPRMRERARNTLVTGKARPELDAAVAADLATRFRPDVEAVRALVGAELPTLTAAWPTP